MSRAWPEDCASVTRCGWTTLTRDLRSTRSAYLFWIVGLGSPLRECQTDILQSDRTRILIEFTTLVIVCQRLSDMTLGHAAIESRTARWQGGDVDSPVAAVGQEFKRRTPVSRIDVNRAANRATGNKSPGSSPPGIASRTDPFSRSQRPASSEFPPSRSTRRSPAAGSSYPWPGLDSGPLFPRRRTRRY